MSLEARGPDAVGVIPDNDSHEKGGLMSDRLLKAVCFSAALFVFALILSSTVLADPCLMVYPGTTCVYHYDPAEYYTVGPGDPYYDPMYDRGGEVLIDINDNGIPYTVYQAPNLVGFVMDSQNQGWYTMDTDFDLIVDGFNNAPITYVNVLLVFDRVIPSFCVPAMTVDGNGVSLYQNGLGWYYPIGDLVVTTPTFGNNYSDIVTVHFTWANCTSIRIYAFSDENYNLKRDGGECFSAFSHDTTVPVEDTTWGAIKEIYSE